MTEQHNNDLNTYVGPNPGFELQLETYSQKYQKI